jgi:hypothetical protein
MEIYIIVLLIILLFIVFCYSGYKFLKSCGYKFLNSCNHDWKIHTTKTESKMEQMLRLTGKCVTPSNDFQLDTLTKKKHITIMTCNCCGKVKRYVEDI